MNVKISSDLLSAPEENRIGIQYGALCYRIKENKPEILLVTSRGTGRWLIPKGWPIFSRDAVGTATVEAWEEAGVIGLCQSESIGSFTYTKTRGSKGNLPCMVEVFPIRVCRLAASFPERDQRRRKWFRPHKAAACVNEPELARMLLEFHPHLIHKEKIKS